MKILAIGDVIGRPGRRAVHKFVPELRREHGLELVIANGENAAGGFGLSVSTAQELLGHGVDVITSGNHIWAQKEIIPYLDEDVPVLRPLNYPPGVPGRGYLMIGKALVVNLIGRTFMNAYDCPFRKMDSLLGQLSPLPPVIIVDFHAEATSEKVAMGRYLDGRVSAVLGTHTHIGTIDARVLRHGTAYVTDIGMTGPDDSIIGDDPEDVIQRFLTQMPHRLTVGGGKPIFNAVIVEVEEASGRALSIERYPAGDAGVSRVDLHVHSNVSDGKLSPPELVRKAAGLGLKVLSLTDHDAVDGMAPALAAAAAFPDLLLIPGVEISTDLPAGEAHILGYYIDYASRELGEKLKKFRNSRQTRARRMVEKLAGLGIAIDYRRVQEIAGEGSIGRPHIARAMLEKGYIATFEEAFEKYLGHGGPAYVERDKMTPEEAVALVLRAGGLPVLAHPFTVGDAAEMAARLKKVGLVGIEAYYKDNTPEQTRATLDLAERYGLVATGGSDYHGIDVNEVEIGGVEVPMEAVESLKKMAKHIR